MSVFDSQPNSQTISSEAIAGRSKFIIEPDWSRFLDDSIDLFEVSNQAFKIQ